MPDREELLNNLQRAIGEVSTLVKDGVVYVDVEVISAINYAILAAVKDTFANDFPNHLELGKGAMVSIELYREIHDAVVLKHAGDLVPEYVPDGP